VGDRVRTYVECLGGVLAGDVEEDFFSTRVLVDEGGDVVDFAVDDHPEVLFGEGRELV